VDVVDLVSEPMTIDAVVRSKRCPARAHRKGAANVLASRYRLEVIWVAATTDATKMVELKAIRDGPPVNLIGPSVSYSRPPSFDVEPTITFLIGAPLPEPAAAVRLRRYPGPVLCKKV
jgi:hypothetical protein